MARKAPFATKFRDGAMRATDDVAHAAKEETGVLSPRPGMTGEAKREYSRDIIRLRINLRVIEGNGINRWLIKGASTLVTCL